MGGIISGGNQVPSGIIKTKTVSIQWERFGPEPLGNIAKFACQKKKNIAKFAINSLPQIGNTSEGKP